VAAEVLEVRSLLSAGALVSHAVHGAERHAHASHPAAGPAFSYNGPFAGTLSVPSFSLSHSYSGTLTIANTTLQAGAAFKSALNLPAVGNVGGFNVGAITGKLAGTIASVVPQGSDQVITINPKSGSLSATVSFSGFTVKPKLAPVKTSPETLTIDSQGHIVSFSGTWHVPAVTPFFAGGDAAFTFTST
jgi:hypothetical protein